MRERVESGIALKRLKSERIQSRALAEVRRGWVRRQLSIAHSAVPAADEFVKALLATGLVVDLRNGRFWRKFR